MENRRCIIHVDIDAFYASVEEIDYPHLKGSTLAVGGQREYGIITTANYEARKYGIHSAMPVFMAKQLCPNLIIQPVRMKRYAEMSGIVFDVLKNYSDIIEKVSVDEAYLDITGRTENPIKYVGRLKEDIWNKTGLTVSVGISYNKFLAKIASDWNKPNGIKTISNSEVPEILLDLDIKKIHGIGPKSQAKLRNIGINTVEDFLTLSEGFLRGLFGKMGKELYDRVRGIDYREVEISRERKSLGIERTFENTRDEEELLHYLDTFSRELEKDLKTKNIGAHTLTVKIKSDDFKTRTRGRTFTKVITGYSDIYEISKELFLEFKNSKKLRLLGITASNLVDLNEVQLSFLE